ncbi:MAG TPA: haloacid dehalogenase-like hydrolase [Terracidiphilus sp.]|nr:haloacid dehalogenase-like hydrolase [Terracidiphilus sp.]
MGNFTIGSEGRLTLTGTEARRLTSEEFKRLVLQGAPRVAVFDCDGTLWGGDAGYGFMAWSMEQGLVSRSTSDRMDTRYREYLAGKVSEVQICADMVQMYAGLREQELREAATRYVDEFVRGRVFAELAELIEALRAAGTELWAVSSTNQWVVRQGVGGFAIPEERILAAAVAVDGGTITSRLLRVPTDEAKAEALAGVGLTRPDAVFGNSIHDLAMLETAIHPFPVNPSPALLKAAAKNGWSYLRPAEAEGQEAAVGGE